MLETLRSRPAVARAAAGASSRRAFAGWLGAPHVSAVSSGTAGPAPGDPRGRASSRATRWSPRRSASSPRPTACSTRTPGRSSATSTRARSTSTRRGRRPRSTDRTTGLLPVHIFGYPADMPAFEALAAERGLWIVEDACEALGAVARRRRARSARAATSRSSASTRTSSSRRARAAWWSAAGEDVKERDRHRAQPGPRARHGLARPRPARLQLPALATSRARSALAQLERLDEMLAARARVAGAGTARRSPSVEGLDLPCPDDGRRPAQLVRLRRAAAAGRATATTRSARCASAASTPSPTCPAIHLMSFYRERFGHREGEFPVCEDVARALARAAVLPRADARAQVERVVGGPARGARR